MTEQPRTPRPDTARPPGEDRQDVGELVADLVSRSPGPDQDRPGVDPRDVSGRAGVGGLGRLVKALGASARTAGAGSVVGGRWLVDVLVDVAPKLPLRDLATLRRQYPGRSDEDIADALVTVATRGTAAVGAAGGALAAVEFAAPPTLLTAPAQIAAETLLVAALEIKMIAELHELYGVPVPGPPRQRATAYLQSWTQRRGIDPLNPAFLKATLGTAAKRQLRRRLLGRAGRNLTTLGPLLSGAAAGAFVNRRETAKLADEVRADLRGRRPRALPAQA